MSSTRRRGAGRRAQHAKANLPKSMGVDRKFHRAVGLPRSAGLGIVRASTIIEARESDEHMKPAEGSTVIGRSVTIRGELSGKEDLYMDGIVEGTITLSGSRLTVGPNARLMADLNAQDVVVYGFVESAVVKGDIAAERLSIEENASIKGQVELSEVTPGSVTGPQPHADLFGAGATASTPA
jgi:cytoskeletal protein CcmA (bactofilin family)